ncbi:MAG: hypothetical protein J6T37_01470 [Bacteroidales bacterium]|nr:hypothetical protein [Bacteroidaceae bacterium]MBO5707680.1 hypothetical protein [Bacteroidaceae bacterium]MBO7528265.1 hypothetical protein [Bacteroidales bacterium]MBO7528526.1 hypothetical protein [Bacteroidales bacterium]
MKSLLLRRRVYAGVSEIIPYQRISYIYVDYDRNHYIDFPINVNAGDYFEVGGTISFGAGSGCLYFMNNQYSNTQFRAVASSGLQTYVGTKTAVGDVSGLIPYSTSEKMSIAVSTTFIKKNDVETSILRPITQGVSGFRLFGGSSSPSWSCRTYLYDFYIKKNNSVIYDLVPVRIGTTGYLYDKKSKQIFANGGSGSFVLGPDIE